MSYVQATEQGTQPSTTCSTFLEKLGPQIAEDKYFWQKAENYCEPLPDTFVQLHERINQNQIFADSVLMTKLVQLFKYFHKWDPANDFSSDQRSNIQSILPNNIETKIINEPLKLNQLDDMIQALDKLSKEFQDKSKSFEDKFYAELKQENIDQIMMNISMIRQSIDQDNLILVH